MASADALSPAEQKRVVKGYMDRETLIKGQVWYPLAFKWWQIWCAYVGYTAEEPSGESPGPIDNAKLEHPDIPGALAKGLAEKYDYVLVPNQVWNYLTTWFGGGPAFPRTVIERGFTPSLELYPHPCKVFLSDDAGEPSGDHVVVLVGRSQSGTVLLKLAAQAHSLQPAQCRVWAKVQGEGAQYHLVNPTGKVEDFAGNDDFTDVLLETKVGARFVRVEPLPPVLDQDGNVVDMDAWRESLVVGMKLDAQDHEEKWYESRVMEVVGPDEPLDAEGTRHDLDGPGDRLKVHFMGWGHKWDSWYFRGSRRLLPLHTKVRNWRDFRATDKVEMKVDGRWHEGQVEEVDRVDNRIRLRPTDKKDKRTIGDKWFEFDSDDLAEAGTHIKRHSVNNYMFSSSYTYRTHTKGTPVAPGVVGLNNLGNTCFMNSMLQCLSNCRVLTEYFLSDAYKREINKDNVLGCGGHLAEAYGQLLKDMWSGHNVVVCPTDFKKQIGAKAPQFQGFQQQDSQELMSFLMDGLHEDLNRIMKKPYVEDTESDGRPDAVVAKEAWDRYLLRNDSIIADFFGGQLRSHVLCNVCDRESVTFDPYLSMSVPLPVRTEKNVIFTFMPYTGEPPVRYKSIVPKQGCIGDVMDWFARESGLPRSSLIVADVYGCKVFRFLPAENPISEIRDNDIIWMYSLPEAEGAADVKAARAEEFDAKRSAAPAARRGHQAAKPCENEPDVVVCMMRCEKPVPHYNPTYGGPATRWDGAADPHLVSVPHTAGAYGRNMTGRQLHDALFPQLARFVKEELAGEYNASSPPYTLNIIAKAAGHAVVSTVPYNDDDVVLKPNQMLAADWAQASYEETFRVDQVARCDMHPSVDVDLAKAEGMSIAKCFERFSVREQLGADDMFYCSKCKDHRRAFKQMHLWSVPQVLIVHLKRFQYSQGVYFVHRDKLDHLVDFPITGLDMSEFVKGPTTDSLVYDLFAVSNHAGGMGGGHYTAYACNFQNGKWYDFNDSYTSAADESRVVSRQAYVLFYERRDGDAPGARDAAGAAAGAGGGSGGGGEEMEYK